MTSLNRPDLPHGFCWVGAFFPTLLIIFCPSLNMAAETARELAAARDVFHRDILSVCQIRGKAITVQPAYAGLPDNPYDALRTGPYFAFRADLSHGAPGIHGFATADGRSAFAQGGHGVEGFLQACGVWRSAGAHPMAVGDVVQRLLWIYLPKPAARLIEGHPVHREIVPPRMDLETRTGACRITFFVTKTGLTGSVLAHQVVFEISPRNLPVFRLTPMP